MSRTSRGDTDTRPVSPLLILDAEHSRCSATSSHVSLAASRSLRSSAASRRRRTVGLRLSPICDPPSVWQVRPRGPEWPANSLAVLFAVVTCETHIANFFMHVAGELSSRHAGKRSPLYAVDQLLEVIIHDNGGPTGPGDHRAAAGLSRGARGRADQARPLREAAGAGGPRPEPACGESGCEHACREHLRRVWPRRRVVVLVVVGGADSGGRRR